MLALVSGRSAGPVGYISTRTPKEGDISETHSQPPQHVIRIYLDATHIELYGADMFIDTTFIILFVIALLDPRLRRLTATNHATAVHGARLCSLPDLVENFYLGS